MQAYVIFSCASPPSTIHDTMWAMDYKAIEKRLQAAHTILHADSINRAAFDSLKTLLTGINPKLDKALSEAGKAWKHIDQIQKSDVIALVVEGLPEATVEQKKRKKALLLFFKWWNDLKSEVARVEKELANDPDAKHHSNAWGKIFGLAKGPLGIVTLVAAGVVMLKASEVTVAIKNIGCGVLTPPSINVPGLKLPGSVPEGGEIVAKMPPLNFTVDATTGSSARVTILGMPYNFEVGRRISVTFDGQEIMGKKTNIDLGSQKEHVLVISCN